MAATVVWKQYTGASTSTTVSASPYLFGTDDSYNAGSTYPVLRPSSGTNYSYETTFGPSASGSFTSLSNWKFYTDGANGLGTGLGIAGKALSSGSYSAASGTQGQTATQISGGTDLFTYTSGSPLSLTGTITSAGAGTVQYVRCQGSVASTSATGTSSSETGTLQWDES